ncbi:hypothetical protein JEP40_18860 [Proteus vulgaris]|uniref:hypothetical protein n=1 Tax=Proteus vulgaris TaxID=585 RepID=UPI0018E42283|nr:hypothetical protein [Proteus vulgaris]MBI6531168.1 hypothetical protein [Proteus vulgaris]
MKNINVNKSNYISSKTNVFVVNDNVKVVASGNEELPAYVYAQSNNAEVVCFEEGAQIYGDSSETVYENPSEFNPATGSKFVTFGDSAIICPGNKSVNCALGDNTIFYTGYELLGSQSLIPENGYHDKYKFLEDSICFSSGEESTIYTSPVEYCVRNTKLISTGKNSHIYDYSPSTNNIIVSTGERTRVSSNGCKTVLSTGNYFYADINNESLNQEVDDLVEKQTIVCLGEGNRIITHFRSTVIVKDTIEWVKCDRSSVLAILTKIDNRPDVLLFYTEDDNGEYPNDIKGNQRINSFKYYRLNSNKELEIVIDPNHQP